MVLDASGEKAAFIFRVPKTGNITKIGWRTGTVTTADDVVVSLETVDVSGHPSGTAYGGSAGTTVALVNTNDNLWFWTTLTTQASATAGDVVAVVISITFVNGNLQIATDQPNLGYYSGFPYLDHFTTVWTKQSTARGTPVCAVEYSDASRPYIATLPISSVAALTYDSGTPTADEYGNRFQLPFKCKVSGAVLKAAGNAGGTLAVNLYNSSDTVIATRTAIDGDHFGGNSNCFYILFNSEVTLEANTLYRITLVPETAQSVSLFDIVCDSAGTLEAMPGGVNFYKTARLDGVGAWTDTNANVATIGLLISALDDGAGGGSVNIFPRRNTLYVPDPVVTL
jgi:hypothetical protein